MMTRSTDRNPGRDVMSFISRTCRIFAFGAVLAVGVSVVPAFSGDAFAADVEGVEIVPGDNTSVLIHLSEGSDGAAVSSFTMNDPNRVIVDIADVRAANVWLARPTLPRGFLAPRGKTLRHPPRWAPPSPTNRPRYLCYSTSLFLL